MADPRRNAPGDLLKITNWQRLPLDGSDEQQYVLSWSCSRESASDGPAQHPQIRVA
jgi:hypothetical protein